MAYPRGSKMHRVDAEGRPVARFESATKPLSDDLVEAVERVLPR